MQRMKRFVPVPNGQEVVESSETKLLVLPVPQSLFPGSLLTQKCGIFEIERARVLIPSN